jgi:hypothetical protein
VVSETLSVDAMLTLAIERVDGTKLRGRTDVLTLAAVALALLSRSSRSRASGCNAESIRRSYAAEVTFFPRTVPEVDDDGVAVQFAPEIRVCCGALRGIAGAWETSSRGGPYGVCRPRSGRLVRRS